MEFMIFGLLCGFICVALGGGGFLAGWLCAGKWRGNRKPTEQETIRARRLQTELENLFRYDGTPQD